MRCVTVEARRVELRFFSPLNLGMRIVTHFVPDVGIFKFQQKQSEICYSSHFYAELYFVFITHFFSVVWEKSWKSGNQCFVNLHTCLI